MKKFLVAIGGVVAFLAVSAIWFLIGAAFIC